MTTPPEIITPPSDVQSEAAVLGSILLDPLAIAKISDLLEPSSFYFRVNRILFEVILKLHSESNPIDLVTVSERLIKLNKLEDIGGDFYLTELSQSTPFPRNVEYYAKIVREKWLLRKLIEIGERTVQQSSNVAAESVEVENYVMDSLLELQKEVAKGFVAGNEVNLEAGKHLDRLQSSDKTIIGVDTGYKMLNRLTLGWQSGDLVILAARPSMGKTSLALNFMYNAALDGVKIGFVSIEMTARELWLRLAANAGKVDYYKLRSGYRNIDVTETLQNVHNLPIWIDDSREQTVNSIRSKAKLLALKGLDILFIDYLQLINQTEYRQTENYNIGLITRRLRALAKELDIPVVLLSQLSRKCEDRNPPRPKISDLRDSGNIEQNADLVLLLYREAWYQLQRGETPTNNIAELTVAKNRNGTTGRVKLAFLGEYQKFADSAIETQTEYTEEPDQKVLDGNIDEKDEDLPF